MDKKRLYSFLLVILISMLSILSISSQSETPGLILEYTIYNFDSMDIHPRVTLKIRNIQTDSLELIISPMEGFDMETRSNVTWYYVDNANAISHTQEGLKVTEKGQSSINYQHLYSPIHYKNFIINTNNSNEIEITYDVNEHVYAGFLETILLRPKNQVDIKSVNVNFVLNRDWAAATVASEELNTFNLGNLSYMYGNNDNIDNNYVPYGYIVAPRSETEIIKTEFGRLIITDYPNPLSSFLNNPTMQLESAAKMFDYFSRIMGDLSPFNSRVVYISWPTWISDQIQPGLYSDYWQHNRTIDLSSGNLPYSFYNWRMSDSLIGSTTIGNPPYSYSHFAHALVRGWFNSGIIRISRDLWWLEKYGILHYYEEDALSTVYGKHKVYERWQDLYNFYLENYVETAIDKSLIDPGDDENTRNFIQMYKSGLWAFILNQRIIELTDGEKNIDSFISILFENYTGSGDIVTIYDMKSIVTDLVGNVEINDLFEDYIFGVTPYDLDFYFEDNDGDGLVNGLELELGYDVNKVDSNDDGIEDSNEYFMDCMENVVNSEYCLESVPEDLRIPTITPTIEIPEATPVHVQNLKQSSPNPKYYIQISIGIVISTAVISLIILKARKK